MIKSLRIENLESHKDTFFEFSPGLNVFVGETDRGKSGSFRAYKWLTQNNPGGEWMRPLYWDGTTTVTGEFINPGLILKRVRDKSENSYILNDEKPINAGTSVPSNIAVLLDLDDVNLQTQIERAFLMFETSGERGRILNRIAGLDEIEQTLSNAKEDVNRLDKLWKAEKTTVEAKEKELEEFVDIDDMEERVGQIDVMQKLQAFSGSRIQNLKKFRDGLKTLKDAITGKEGVLAAESTLEDLKAKLQAVQAAELRVMKLKRILILDSGIKWKEAAENFEGVEERFEKIRANTTALELSSTRVKKLKRLLSDFSIIGKEIAEVEDELKDLQAKIPNICSECGREL